MFKDLLSAVIYEMTHFLSRHEDFFTEKSGARESLLENSELPKFFKNYLAHVSEEAFLKDMAFVASFEAAPLKDSPFFNTFVQFLTGPFATKLDQLTGDFYHLPVAQRRQVVDKLIKGDHRIAQALKQLYVNKNPQVFGTQIQKLMEKIKKKSSFIVVQSPREITPEMKKEIRESLREQEAEAFPHFQINRSLIGGLRVFKNGKTEDHSWLNRVLRFTSLTTS